MYQLHPIKGPDGWHFNGEDDGLSEDPLHGFKTLKQLYHLADPDFSGRYTVPVLWDKKTSTIINNESSEIIRMFYEEFDELLTENLREINKPTGGLYPKNLRQDIDQMNDWVYHTINNGVYKVGYARTQEDYDKNILLLFQSLDRIESILGDGKKYLFGDHITETDIRLYTTLVRFDVAYHTIFMCNLKSIRHDYPRLYLWLRRLYWDQDEDGEARGSFYLTTSPYIKQYSYGYAVSRRKMVYQNEGPLIIPVGPTVVIDPLP
jgi:putative glutathione S-transferase